MRRHWPAPVAAVLAGLTFVASGILRHTYPFGDRPRSTNDLGQQIVPMYAHYRDVLTGHGGDLFFNWSSGFGVPFLGDFMAYVGSTLSWITVLFPRDRVDLVLFLVDVLAIGLAAGAMTAYLRYLRPGPAWVAVIAGVSYGACGWAIDDAAYMSVWLNGLVAFPVLCLLCEWILRRRSAVSMMVTPVVVALLWTSHFYTVYMALIGAALVVVARLLAYDATVSWRHRLTGGVRCIVAVSLGTGLAAPLLLPTFEAVRAARPSPDVVFQPVLPLNFLARLLPGSEGVGTTPGLAVGTVMLLLAVSLPFNRLVPARERIVWTATVVLAMLSLQFRITHEIWHGFDAPNGSPYRQAFVVAGLLVVVGWISLSAGIRSVLTVAAPIGAVLLLYFVSRDIRSSTRVTHLVVPVMVVVALGVWVLNRWPRWVRRGAVAVLVAAVFVEVTLSSAAIDERRSKILSAKAPWGDEHTALRSLVTSAADWPTYRTAPGAEQTVNDPMLIGGQGPQYYSSTMPDRVSQQLLDLGFGYSSYGRAVVDPRNPVVDAIFAIRSRVVVDPGARLERSDVPPVVTVRPATAWSSSDPGPFGAQESALGADVYTVPSVRTEKGRATVLLASCAPGSEIWFAAPDLVGTVLVPGRGWVVNLSARVKSPGLYAGAPMLRAGTVGASGIAAVPIRPGPRATLPATPIGCLDPAKLKSAVRSLTPPTPPKVKATGHTITIHLTPSTTATTLVISTIRTKGWHCSPNATPDNRAGLIAVPLPPGTSDLSCTYHPPGLSQGLTIGAITALGLLLAAVALARVRRTRAAR
ncbi:YfhO family protein [Kribbella sp. NPDC003557]|uniref:YfhO family protein n=1 Tax=Kribbella sp. NPDC003557 TaxID=3154449 RepID=UPI00339FFE11